MARILNVARSLAILFTIQVCLVLGGTATSAQEVGTYAYVDVRALNLRAGPGTGAAVLGTLPFGASVSILDRKGTWANVFVQGATGQASEGWVATRFLSRRTGAVQPGHGPVAPLRVSKLDFDCRPALFGNSGIRKCVASVRVQLPRQEYDPNRNDRVFIACRGVISYRTEGGRFSGRLVAIERMNISRDDRLGQSVRVDFPVRSVSEKIISARLAAFSCGRD